MKKAKQIASRLLEDDFDPKEYAMSMPKCIGNSIMARCLHCGHVMGNVHPDWLNVDNECVQFVCDQCSPDARHMRPHAVIRPIKEDDEDDPKEFALNALTTQQEPFPRLRQHNKIFRRKGDNVSAREFDERHKLSDGTYFAIALSLMYYPSNRSSGNTGRDWYIHFTTTDRRGHSASDFTICNVKQARVALNRGRAGKGKLAGLPARQRLQIIAGWLKKL